MLTVVDTPESSNIAKLVYNSETQTLEVTFKNETIYLYFKVPEEIWDTFKHAESKGKFFAAHIKGVFEFEKIAAAD